MSADRFASRIESLDPESRAIVELAIGRGFSDEDLAGMLGTSVERVGERRERALEHLGARTARDRDAVADALRAGNGASAGTGAAAGPAATAGASPAAAAPATEPPERSPHRRAIVMAIFGALLVAIAIGVTVVFAGSDAVPEPEPISSGEAGDPEAPSAGEAEAPAGGGAPPEGEAPPEEQPPPPEEQPPPSEDEPPPAAENEDGSQPARLEPPAGGGATGTVELLPAEGDRGRRLLLDVRGLGPNRRAGGYGIWLYDSVSSASMIAGSTRGTFRAQVRLPPSADRYRFLDVSFEPPDGNRNHSGASRLRVPLGEILGG